jgi:hypothetical protein
MPSISPSAAAGAPSVPLTKLAISELGDLVSDVGEETRGSDAPDTPSHPGSLGGVAAAEVCPGRPAA